jgi:hypothetical protein
MPKTPAAWAEDDMQYPASIRMNAENAEGKTVKFLQS